MSDHLLLLRERLQGLCIQQRKKKPDVNTYSMGRLHAYEHALALIEGQLELFSEINVLEESNDY